MPVTRKLATLIGLIPLMLGPAGNLSAADAWPTQPIHFIIPYAPGGGMDVTARLLGDRMSKSLGTPILVENKPGASTTLATSYVVRSQPDGYTLLFTDSTHGSNPALYKTLPYRTMEDLQSVALVTLTPAVLVVRSSLGVNSVADLVALAKKEPGKLNYSSAGLGSVMHLSTELFKRQAGIDVAQINYAGAAPALNALVAEQVDLMFIPPTTLVPHLKSGKLKALAVASDKRLELLPDVPTFREAGYPEVVVGASLGVRVPKGTPPAVIARLNEAFNEAIKEPEFQEKARSWGAIAVVGPPQKMDDYLLSEIARWSKTVTPDMQIQ